MIGDGTKSQLQGVSSSTGATGADSGGTGAAGGTTGGHKLFAAIDQQSLLGSLDSAFSSSTLQTGAGGQDLVVQPGADVSESFKVALGDKLDLTQLLAGAPLNADLSNLSSYVKVVGYSQNDPGFGPGTKTTLEITGPGGQATVNLEGAGKIDLNDLLSHNSLILPPH